jgi:hypothetical protein
MAPGLFTIKAEENHFPDAAAEGSDPWMKGRIYKPSAASTCAPETSQGGRQCRQWLRRLPLSIFLKTFLEFVNQPQPDGTFPNGIPNPLLPENREPRQGR